MSEVRFAYGMVLKQLAVALQATTILLVTWRLYTRLLDIKTFLSVRWRLGSNYYRKEQ